jgi:fructuronate reductase/mannitol 2-dehydrogenase
MAITPGTAPQSDGATIHLDQDRLEALPDTVDVPDYERLALTPSVVHIGVGAFHRSHQAVYFDDLVRQGISTQWGLVGVGMHSPRIGEVLSEQDNLYTVITRGPDHEEVRVVGVVTRFLFAPEDPGAVLDVLASPQTRLVTLTVTAAGYPSDGSITLDDPDVAADVQHPEFPATAFGYLVEALRRRRESAIPPFTVLSCDNVAGNGPATRSAVVGIARLRDPALAEWIERSVAFPGSMVDRITPETTDQTRERLARDYSLQDRWPVIAEPFSQWVVEDAFCNGRPPLDRVGVQFVESVLPHEFMKARLLNGSHCALGYLGRLAGKRTSDEAMADPAVHRFIDGFLREAAAVLPEVPGIDLDEYRRTLQERFANPGVADQLSRLCRRGSTKVRTYLLPSIERALELDRPRRHLVLALAAWIRYLEGVDYADDPIDVQDARADELRPLAEQAAQDPAPLLSVEEVFGDLGTDPRLAEEVRQALADLQAGPLEAAAAVAESGEPAGAPAR